MITTSTKDKWLNGLLFVFLAFSSMLAQKIFIPKFDSIAGNLISGAHTASLRSGDSISQPFVSNKDGLSTIQVLFAKEDKSYPRNAAVTWDVLSDDGSVVAHGNIPVRSISSGAFHTLKFDPLKKSGQKNYILRVSSSLDTDGLAMASSPVSQSEFYSYRLNDQVQDGTIVFYTGYSTPDFNARIIIRGFLIAIPLWIVLLYRERIVQVLDEQPLHLTVTTIIIGIGSLMIAIQPPLHMFDEPEHFRRIWEISTGKLLPSAQNGVVSTRLPRYIQETFNRIYRSVDGTTQNPAQIAQMLSEPAGNEHDLSANNGLISTYSFLAYVLPALFVRVGIWLGSSALGLIYLARFASLVTFASLTFWALKHSVVGQQTIATVSLLALVITQAVAINVDSLMIAGSFLFLASVFNLIWAQDSSLITKNEISPLVFGAFCILASKHIYIPLLGLVMLIPAARFGSLKGKFKWVLIFLCAAGLTAIVLQIIITPGNDPRIDTSGIDPSKQLRFVLGSPVTWLKTFTLTIINNGFVYYNQFNLLNGTHTSIGIFGIIQLAAVLFFSWSENDSLPVKIMNWHRLFAFLIAVITSMFVMLPLYLYWTPVGSSFINGLQGRYFLPVIVLMLVVTRPNLHYNGEHIKAKLLASMTFLLLVQVWLTYSFFY